MWLISRCKDLVIQWFRKREIVIYDNSVVGTTDERLLLVLIIQTIVMIANIIVLSRTLGAINDEVTK
jgi:hypothetical protein